jgi:hypothetical protein
MGLEENGCVVKHWALTSVVCEPPDRYADEIVPITWPLMARYAERHDMDWRPKVISRMEYNDFAGKGTAPHGTASVYASIPHRRALLDQYDGVVFFDCDTIVMGDAPDICTEVTEAQPIGTEPACNCATMVLLSCAKTKEMLDHIWAMRHGYSHYQWLEQAAYMELMGYDGKYPGDNLPPRWLGETRWTPLRADINRGWNAHPLHPLPEPLLSVHPGGFQPFERRLAEINRWVAVAQSRATIESQPTGGENP